MRSPIHWSDSLKAQTHKALESHGLDMHGSAFESMSFKNADGGYGLMPVDDLLVGRFFIHRRCSDATETFDTPDAVFEAGWVLD